MPPTSLPRTSLLLNANANLNLNPLKRRLIELSIDGSSEERQGGPLSSSSSEKEVEAENVEKVSEMLFGNVKQQAAKK